MQSEQKSNRNWFDQGGSAYARFRPEYPPELAEFLAAGVGGNDLAIDVGCGNGQLTTQLANHFQAVVGIDPSSDQVRNAVPKSGVRYLCAPAERLPVPDGCASLITAAQAAHWFDLPAFYAEARRVAGVRAAIALISYGVMKFDDEIDARFRRFYRDEIGPYWPPERKLVDSGYSGIDFPFDEHKAPPMEIRQTWDLEQLLGYISTWSAVRGIKEAGREGLLQEFATDLRALWGDAKHRRPVAWPISMRLGTA